MTNIFVLVLVLVLLRGEALSYTAPSKPSSSSSSLIAVISVIIVCVHPLHVCAYVYMHICIWICMCVPGPGHQVYPLTHRGRLARPGRTPMVPVLVGYTLIGDMGHRPSRKVYPTLQVTQKVTPNVTLNVTMAAMTMVTTTTQDQRM